MHDLHKTRRDTHHRCVVRSPVRPDSAGRCLLIQHILIVRCRASAEVAAQHQRRGAALDNSLGAGRLRGIRRADRARAGRRIVVHRLREIPSGRRARPSRRRCRSSSGRAKPRPRHAGAMATERISASPAAMRDRMKPISVPPGHRAVGDDIAFDQQPIDLVFAPAALERGPVHGGDRGGIARPRLGEGGLGRGRAGGRQSSSSARQLRGVLRLRVGRAQILRLRRRTAFRQRRRPGAPPRRYPARRARRRTIGGASVGGKLVGDRLRGRADDAGARLGRRAHRFAQAAPAAARSAVRPPAAKTCR